MDLKPLLSQLEREFVAARPNTAALHERAAHVMPGGNTRTVLHSQPFPILIAHAEGYRLTDVDGHSYIDFVGEYSAGLYGHSHPRIKQAVAEAMAIGLNMSAQHANEIAFAEAVARRFRLERVRFTNSGTEANVLALMLARHFTGKPAIMPMLGGYHGATLYFSHPHLPVNVPFPYVLGAFNDVDATRGLIRQHKDSLAAIILEPMLGSGGCIAASPSFLSMLREESAANDIVLVFDEVMTSRLHPHGLAAAVGIQPDLITLGKYIGGGMSAGAFGGKAEIMDLFDPRRADALPHAGTFNNNTLTMTAGRVALEEIFTSDACRALNARGENLKERLNDVCRSYQLPLQVTGIGSLMTIHACLGLIQQPSDLARGNPHLKRLLYLSMLQRGIYIAERGLMALSLVIDDAACDSIVAALDDCARGWQSLDLN